MAPPKPSWVVALVLLALIFVTKAAAIEPTGVEAGNTGGNVDSPLVPPSTRSSATTPAGADILVDVDSSAGRPRSCKLLHRQEWRNMSSADKSAYIKAVQCLQRLKPIAGIPHSRSRFDDFQALHGQVMTRVHLVAHFLAWHRWFMYLYVSTMRQECGYKGSQPYWDWTLDVKSFPKSPIFDPKTGFGSLVQNGRGPVRDGPFHTYELIFGTGPPPNITKHYVERGFNASMLQYITSSEVNRILSQPTFDKFHIELEGQPLTALPRIHDAGHYVIGGDVADPYGSPGDPLFYLHHANLDRIWWKWQKSRPGRLYEISGRTTQTPPFVEITLDFVLPMGQLANSTAVRNVMDIENSLCYTYV